MTLSVPILWPDAARGREGAGRSMHRCRMLALTLLSCALAGGAAALMVFGQARFAVTGASAPLRLIDRLEELAGKAGLGIDQVEVSGQRFAADGDILDAVDLANVRTYLSFDSAAIRARIERLPWVDTATIERMVPNRVGIRITERRPFAVWDRGPRDILIDASGRPLATVAKGHVADLPRIVGEQAPEDARRLLELVAGFPEINQRLARAERIGGRRWSLVLHHGPRIELPAEADATALALLFEARAEGRLIDLEVAVIDMTVSRRVAVRPIPAPARGR